MSLKNPVTPLEIDPGIIQLVAQCLNHYATPGPCSTYTMEYTSTYNITNAVKFIHFKMKLRLLYLNTHFVLHSKHFSSQL
jgi:hypothetical protein